ncbi:MAG: DUF3419 family protein [Bdellovibrionales bacterium]|nr:DUF3419 family protein [Bdellovibrionales bacterium]
MGFRYFEKLNYTLANEDPSLETEVLQPDQGRVAAVGGSGARILPLLSKRPGEMHIIDISRAQLALCELRIETLRRLTHEEFLRFWYPWVTAEDPLKNRQWRKERLAVFQLAPDSYRIVEERFQNVNWDAITLTGKWEQTFSFFSRLARIFLGKSVLDQLFSFQSLAEQRIFIQEKFPRSRFRALIRLAGSARTFNALLYRGRFPVNNSGMPYVKYYEDAFWKLFSGGLARENFFLQLSLLGRIIGREALPLEADEKIFQRSKEHAMKGGIFFHHDDLVSVIQKMRGVDFVSFSNVPAYFTGEMEREFLRRIGPSLKPGARVVIRHYLHYPEGLDRSGYRKINELYPDALRREKIQMYDPEILERDP